MIRRDAYLLFDERAYWWREVQAFAVTSDPARLRLSDEPKTILQLYDEPKTQLVLRDSEGE